MGNSMGVFQDDRLPKFALQNIGCVKGVGKYM